MDEILSKAIVEIKELTQAAVGQEAARLVKLADGREVVFNPDTGAVAKLPKRTRAGTVRFLDADAFREYVNEHYQGAYVVVGSPISAAAYDDEQDLEGDEMRARVAELASAFPDPLNVQTNATTEHAILWLRRTFEKNTDRDELLALISNLTSSDSAVIADDGLSQNVTTKVGVIKSGKATTRESYMLKPFDPFTVDGYDATSPLEVFVRVTGEGAKLMVNFHVVNGPSWLTDAMDVLRKALAREGGVRVY
jgi:hypothetical protein